MASGEVFSAIRTYLTTNWTTTTIRWENEPFVLPVDSAFVDVEMTGTLYGRESIGASPHDRWDEEGVLWLHTLVPANTGGQTARDYAKALADLFRNETSLMSGDLEFFDAFIGRGQPGAEDGSWYRVTTFIKWRRVDA